MPHADGHRRRRSATVSGLDPRTARWCWQAHDFMLDLLVAGAGPSGCIAALVAARAGARVLLIDRDDFPRDKLCGDTLNPGAVRLLTSLGLSGGALDRALALRGMR